MKDASKLERRLDESAVVFVYGCIGAGSAGIVAMCVAGLDADSILLAVAIGTLFGILSGICRVLPTVKTGCDEGSVGGHASIGSTDSSDREDTTPQSGVIQPPPPRTVRPFRERLAQFTHQDESEVMPADDGFRSKMPLRIAFDLFCSVPPKSARMIRFYLRSIRRALDQHSKSA